MKHKVAVFGSLRKGLHNFRLLKNSTFLGECKTKEKFKMFSMGGFPGLRLEGNSNITIEVYEVSDEEFSTLDVLEGYPNFYNRKLTETEFGDAWIYFNEKEMYDGDEISSGDWSKYLKEE